MLDALYVVVPMTVHEVCYHTTCSLGKVLGILLDDFVEVDALEEDDLLAVRREKETLHLALSL